MEYRSALMASKTEKEQQEEEGATVRVGRYLGRLKTAAMESSICKKK